MILEIAMMILTILVSYYKLQKNLKIYFDDTEVMIMISTLLGVVSHRQLSSKPW